MSQENTNIFLQTTTKKEIKDYIYIEHFYVSQKILHFGKADRLSEHIFVRGEFF